MIQPKQQGTESDFAIENECAVILEHELIEIQKKNKGRTLSAPTMFSLPMLWKDSLRDRHRQ
jgi:hypothetical protein